jgi:hypothetical protein
MECASKIIDSPRLQEAIAANLYYEAQDQRLELIMTKLTKLANGLHRTQ